MNIKVGDKVRIKTKEELLAEGWERCYEIGDIMINDEYGAIFSDQIGRTGTIYDIDEESVLIDMDYWVKSVCIAEVIPQTLDEYICGLPLEERAKYFVYRSEYDWYSTLFGKDAHFVFEEEALQATIEALKEAKE